MSVSTPCHQDEYVAYSSSDAQVKVREATSNDPWGPSIALMSEIADLTHNQMAFTEIMSIVWKRLNDTGKNWRHVHKCLILLDFLIKCGHEKVAQQCRENVFTIETLKDFQHVEDNRDQGLNIRENAKQIISLLSDNEQLKNERTRFLLTRNKFKQNNPGPVGAHVTDSLLDSKLEEARPSTATEEQMQLQIASALSHEEYEKAGEMRKIEDARFKMALEKSQSLADRLASVEQELVSSDQLTQAALEDLLSLRVGEVVTGYSGHPSPSNAWNKMGTSESVVVPGLFLGGNTLSSTPATTSVQKSSTPLHTNDAVFASNNDSLTFLTPSQPAAASSDQFAAWGISAASAPAATLTTSNSFDLLGGDECNDTPAPATAKTLVSRPETSNTAVIFSGGVIVSADSLTGNSSSSTSEAQPKSFQNLMWDLDEQEQLWIEKHPRFEEYLALERKQNAFMKFTSSQQSSLEESLETYSVESACRFGAASRLWFDKQKTATNLPQKKFDGTIPTFNGHLGIYAFYRVLVHIGQEKVVLTPVHSFVPARHRRDLMQIEADFKTETRNFPFSVVNHLLPGDIVMVTRIARTEVAFDPSFSSSDVTKCQWRAIRMSVFTRNVEENKLFYHVNSIDKVFVEGHHTAHDVRKTHKFREDFMVRQGSVFVPTSFNDKFEWAQKKHRSEARRLSCQLLPEHHFSGTVFNCKREFTATKEFDGAFEALSNTQDNDDLQKGLKVIQMSLRLADSASQGTHSQVLDRRSYCVSEVNVISSSRISFEIVNNQTINTDKTWLRGTNVTIYDGADSLSGVVEEVSIEPQTLRLTIELDELSSKATIFSEGAFVKQTPAPCQPLLPKDFLINLPRNSNGWKIVSAVFGGPSIEDTSKPTSGKFTFPGDHGYVLDECQSDYVSKILQNVPIVIGSSPFGCGKSATIVVAAYEKLKKNGKLRQLLLTQSNFAAVNLMTVCGKIGNKLRPLRFISERNWTVQPAANKCEFDLPTLLPTVLQTALKSKRVSRDESRLIEKYLEMRKNSSVEDSVVLKRTYESVLPVFIRIYDPNVISTTIDTLDSLLKHIPSGDIDSVQIDEGSQVPLVKFVKCVVMLRDSTFGVLGDIHQLPPFKNGFLEGGVIEEYAYGSIMEMSLEKKLFPNSTLRFIYRSHPTSTNLLSELFYNDQLETTIRKEDRNEFMKSMTHFWPNPECPYLVIDNCGKDAKLNGSRINIQEQEIVQKIVDMLKQKHGGYRINANNLGIISLYREQSKALAKLMSNLERVKIGTVDSFQGNEKQLVILATTTTERTPHLEFNKRTLVALSRSRECMIIIGNVSLLKQCNKWSGVVDMAAKMGNILYDF